MSTTTMEVASTPAAASSAALRPFACPACSSRFTRLENLNRHTRSVHRESNQRPFPCPYCDVSFSRSDLRKRHIKKSHQKRSTSPRSPVQPLTQNNAQTNGTTEEPADIFSPNDISWLFKLPQFISAYFEKFHPNFPALHKPSIDMATTKEPLLQAIACVGAVYHDPAQRFSTALFEAGLKALDNYIKEDRSRFREIWVLQAYILFEHFAIYSCQEKLYPRGVSIHRTLVDAAREFQMLQDGAALTTGSPDASMDHDDLITEESRWKSFIEHESQKRVIFSLYYLDSQLAVSCNMRPLLSALELKWELPCPDNLWSSPNATAWSLLSHIQNSSFNMNEEDDYEANPDPRPAHGDLYECLLHLIHPTRTVGTPLGLLWYSPFASLILIIQMQMMIRDMTMASVFFCTNITLGSTRHNLSLISEENRAQIFQALHSLADLIPKVATLNILDDTTGFGVDESAQSDRGNKTLWHSVWLAWHYTAMTLSHQDALLTTGIVELGLPNAISTCWELGRPRSKNYRDVYNDRDFTRIVDHLEQIIELINKPTISTVEPGSSPQSAEDPFMTMLGFKACIMGWRVVRLMALSVEHMTLTEDMPLRSSISTTLAQVVLARLMEAINSGSQEFIAGATSDVRYLNWAAKAFSLRNTWPTGPWMVAAFQDTQKEVV